MNKNKILDEVTVGYDLLASISDGVTVFGSARVPESAPEYLSARNLGALLAKANLPVITGGGPGIMEAANRGAYEASGESIGFNIVLPHEQHCNPYLTKAFTFDHFYIRKVMLVERAKAFVVFPGGFGTLDELFEVVNLINTHTIKRVPIVLVGKKFWMGLIDWLQTQFPLNGYASMEESRFVIVDSAEEAIKEII